MGNNNSSLETLAAFAICFVAGVVSTIGLQAYTKREYSEMQNAQRPPIQS